jgi:hypothetical protein
VAKQSSTIVEAAKQSFTKNVPKQPSNHQPLQVATQSSTIVEAPKQSSTKKVPKQPGSPPPLRVAKIGQCTVPQLIYGKSSTIVEALCKAANVPSTKKVPRQPSNPPPLELRPHAKAPMAKSADGGTKAPVAKAKAPVAEAKAPHAEAPMAKSADGGTRAPVARTEAPMAKAQAPHAEAPVAKSADGGTKNVTQLDIEIGQPNEEMRHSAGFVASWAKEKLDSCMWRTQEQLHAYKVTPPPQHTLHA